MTMFSMKPQFNLAEFLATPAPKGKALGARRRSIKPQLIEEKTAATPVDEIKPAE